MGKYSGFASVNTDTTTPDLDELAKLQGLMGGDKKTEVTPPPLQEDVKSFTDVRGRETEIQAPRGEVGEGDINPDWFDAEGNLSYSDKLIDDLNPAKSLAPEGAFDVEAAFQATQGGVETPTSDLAIPYGTGAKASYTTPEGETYSQPIVDLLNSESSLDYEGNIKEVSTRKTRAPTLMAEAVDTVKEWAPRQEEEVNKLIGNLNQGLMDPNSRAQLQRLMASNKNITAESMTEFAYSKLATADNLMRKNTGKGLAGAMQLAYMYDLNARQKAAYRAKEDFNVPKDAKARERYWKALSNEQRRAMHQLENAAFFDENNPTGNNSGSLIAQAADLQTNGIENTIASEMASITVPKAFPELFDIREMTDVNGNTIKKPVLTREAMSFVDDNIDLFTHVLKLPPKMPRAFKKAKADAKPDIRMKGKLSQDIFTSEESERQVSEDLLTLDNTPNTVLATQTRMLGLLLSVDSMPTTLSAMFDHANYKDIAHGGVMGNRTKVLTTVDLDGNRVREAYFGDSEKDTKATINLTEALALVGKQFYFDHFLASNLRPHVESTVLNYQSDKLSRAILGFGVSISYKLNRRNDMQLLKGGIMKRTGMKDADGVKYEAKTLASSEEAFNNNVDVWVSEFGELVSYVKNWDHLDNNTKMRVEEDLMSEDSPVATQAAALIKLGQEHDGYSTLSSVIEAVTLRQAEQNKNHAEYATNFLTEVDGLTNGMAQNAMWAGAEKQAARAGVTKHIVDSIANGSLLEMEDMYVRHTSIVSDLLYSNSNPKIRKMAKLFEDEGLVSRSESKGPIMIAGYSAGEALIKFGASETIKKLLAQDNNLSAKLRAIGVVPELAIKTLEDSSYLAVQRTVGSLKDYGDYQAQFMAQLIKQKQADPSLPDPSIVFPEGIRMLFGLMVPTVYGPELEGADGNKFRAIRNELVFDAKEINKETGFEKGHIKAISAVAPKTTHYGDALMVRASARRAAKEGIADKYSTDGTPYGNIFAHIFDGFLLPPMLARESDVILNDEFLNLGKRASNLKGLIDTAKAAGYDLNTSKALRDLVSSMLHMSVVGRNFVNTIKHVNQFPIDGNKTSKKAAGSNTRVFEPSIVK
jgi:hypothetical protein